MMWGVCNRLVLGLTFTGLFVALVNCQDAADSWELCKLASNRGDFCENSSNYTIRWFYDESAEGCARFWYMGCGGNGNNFLTEESCNERCTHTEGTGECIEEHSQNFHHSYIWFYIHHVHRSIDLECTTYLHQTMTPAFKESIVNPCQQRYLQYSPHSLWT